MRSPHACHGGRTEHPLLPLAGKKVLVVEDEVIIAMMIQYALQDEGADVIGPAFTVQQALDLLEQNIPDVATLDLNLAGEMATKVVSALDKLNIPILLASAYGEHAIVPLPAALGVVRKPYSTESFIAAVIAVLAKRELDQYRSEAPAPR
ncbi:MAG: response regulator [Cytophagaceae bacterium]|nr:MAG: response regulator [Cytophagaceae bacterium]